ncbi:hypothetical protein [Mesorhizobium sp. M0522]|uniref:hypothetical protein n=1 Tax=Mesorhizobium sp. M0522 TaxID=2956958 RepID=UPI003337F9E3
MNADAFWSNGARDPGLFRFTVKCDRAMNAKIEKAARAAGISASSFVQNFFEKILDQPAVMASAEEIAETRREIETARSCGITVSMLRIHRAMKDGASERGTFADGVGVIAEATGLPPSSIRVMMSKLVTAGLIRRLKSAARGTTGIYHVFSIGDDR